MSELRFIELERAVIARANSLDEIERLIRAYADDVEEMVACFAEAEPHDTERPPAPEFTRDEVGTFEPVIRTLADADEVLRGEPRLTADHFAAFVEET